MAIPADAVDFEQVKAVADGAVEKYGRLDTWVHLAAVSLYATFEQTAPEEFKRVIETNLVGQAYGAMAALPHLRRTGQGALIHVSSVEGKRALPLQSAYASSKHGVIGFLDALRLELQHEGVPISVTNVMPAGINTPFFNKARTKMGVKPMPMPPIYQPDVVADVILYAAEHPTRDIEAGGAAKVLILNQRLSPRMMDAMLVRTGFKGQQTEEPKSDNAPANLFHPIGDYNRVQGDFTDQAKESAASWLDTHPAARKIVKGAALAAVAVMAARAFKDRR
jgi:short-subunit dehydrogenase